MYWLFFFSSLEHCIGYKIKLLNLEKNCKIYTDQIKLSLLSGDLTGD